MPLLVDIPRPGSGNTNNGNSAKRFFQEPNLAALYPWFYMPSSVHKILIHGVDIIRILCRISYNRVDV